MAVRPWGASGMYQRKAGLERVLRKVFSSFVTGSGRNKTILNSY
jgi:hypothetical protein